MPLTRHKTKRETTMTNVSCWLSSKIMNNRYDRKRHVHERICSRMNSSNKVPWNSTGSLGKYQSFHPPLGQSFVPYQLLLGNSAFLIFLILLVRWAFSRQPRWEGLQSTLQCWTWDLSIFKKQSDSHFSILSLKYLNKRVSLDNNF